MNNEKKVIGVYSLKDLEKVFSIDINDNIENLGYLVNEKIDKDNFYKEFDKIEAMICSMTKQEKRNTKLLNGSRRLRIAKGSGTTVQDVNKFIKSFEMTQKMMKQIKNSKGGMKGLMKNMNLDVDELGKMMK